MTADQHAEIVAVLDEIEAELRHLASQQCQGCNSCDGGSGDGLVLAAMHVADRRRDLGTRPGRQSGGDRS